MMTSSNGDIFRVTGHLCGEFTGPGEFPTQRPVTRSFDVYFDLRPNKRLSKQSWGWWFETLSWSLWRYCNETADQLCIWCASSHYHPPSGGVGPLSSVRIGKYYTRGMFYTTVGALGLYTFISNWESSVKITTSGQLISNRAPDWQATLLSVNSKPCQKIAKNYFDWHSFQ